MLNTGGDLRNIKLLFEKMVRRELMKKEIQIFILGYLQVEKYVGDVPFECIDTIIANYNKLDAKNFCIDDDGLSGWFKYKLVDFLSDAYFFGVKENCFSNEDITKIFFIFQLLHDYINANNSLRFDC